MDNASRRLPPPALVICLGASRSGLNLFTQCLQLLGFAMPDSLIAGPSHIHALLCRDLGISSRTVGSLPRGWQETPAAQNARQRIRNLLVGHAEAGKPRVLSDPFLARCFPVWQDVFAELDLKPRLIHFLRHPWEVARSLAAVEKMELAQAHILWLAHVRDALCFCHGQNHVLVTFDQLLADPVSTLYSFVIPQDPATMSARNNLTQDSLLFNYVRPELKHHFAGSASESERQRFAPFIHIYNDQCLFNARVGSQVSNASKEAGTAAHENGNASGNGGLLDVMFQVLGQYEAREYEHRTQVMSLPAASQTVQPLFSEFYVPIKKDTYNKKHYLLFPDQWQKISLDILRPDLLTDTPLRLFPLNTTGIATISNVRFVDRSTNNVLWLIRTFDDNRILTLKNAALRLPSENSLVLFVTGKTAEVVFSDVSQLPDRPIRVEMWIRVCVNPTIYYDTLRAFLSRESWKAILGLDPEKKDTDSLLHLSGAFEKAGCLTEADIVLQKGVEMHPASESLRMAFAELAMKRQSWVEAIRRWQDLAAFMGQHTQKYVYQQLNDAYRNQNLFPMGRPEEESHMGDGDKHEMLSAIHRVIGPELYVEIGVQEGKSLALSQCKAIGIDPMPQVTFPLSEKAEVLSMTSDDFFKGPATDLLRQPPDLVFIDGMHFFEYALRDFMNVERFAASWTLVVIDDIFPAHSAQAERQRITRTWTGDVWKLYVVLEKYRPDLFFMPINISPTGLLLIAGLNQDNKVLWDNYDEIVEQYTTDMVPPDRILTRDGVFTSKHMMIPGVLDVLKNSREQRLSTKMMLSHLKEKSGLR